MGSDMDALFWRVGHDTVSCMFEAIADACPDRIFVKGPDIALTYSEAAEKIAAVSDLLGKSARGRSVAIILPNSATFLIAYYAVLAAGAAPALVNYAHPDATVMQLLDGLDVAAVLSDRAIPGLKVTHFDGATLETLTGGHNMETQAGQTAAILFSGGTTGLPKQIAHSHEALIRKVERMEWGWPTQDGEVWLPVAPFSHVYGFLMGVLNPVLRGGTIVIPPRFHPDLIVDMLQDEAVTVFGGGPPAIYQALMASEKFGDTRFPNLRVCPGGGAPFPLDVHRRWTEATGLPITEGYGMTEIAPITVNTESDGIKPGAAGKPVPDTVVEIVDLATGKEVLACGEFGEIRVKGPHMMTGYISDPEETAIALRDGYVYTGDIGCLDAEGFLTISDRKKDVIFVKGFNVFPREVEEVLLSHDAVAGACVVGRADDRSGEVSVAFVTLRSASTSDTILAHCSQTLAAYKLPAAIVVLDALPMTPAAKVDRAALRAQAGGLA